MSHVISMPRATSRALLALSVLLAIGLWAAGSASAAFDRMVYIKDAQIFQADLYGGAPSPLTTPASGSPRAYTANLSPNGQLVAFDDGPSGNLWLLDIGSGSLKKLYANTTYNPGNAKFAPNGRKLVFNVGRGNDGDIYTINVDGAGLTKVVGWKDGQTDPDFSPSRAGP